MVPLDVLNSSAMLVAGELALPGAKRPRGQDDPRQEDRRHDVAEGSPTGMTCAMRLVCGASFERTLAPSPTWQSWQLWAEHRLLRRGPALRYSPVTS